ncbi:LysM peptidoglycan-binding domain-containing protein [Streptomyces albus subsp. chlorinus]|uniref:transglycosylase SLT domain-containing protein n=1 Tax=Streptomyces albus TaxID=1888 RepID=UPI0015700AFB|nr:LysM peptidoglycan-binding domain-containing protein [Streptomyces albus]NSC20145.1 LysM peptidoglycan-binding domain-containing protein [Streptomyces albus subsp. chlorinus]
MFPGRRAHDPSSTRRLTRVSLALLAGGAGIAAPLLTAGGAHAAAPAQPKEQAQVVRTGTAPQAKTAEESGSYTVAGGDTLYRIAVDHDVKGGWSALYKANKQTIGGDANLIRPGQKLTLDVSSAPAERSAAPERADRSSAERSGGVQKTRSTSLDGWINEALAVMKQHGIPGTYEGIHRNIIRESGGNPNAINNWDINAQNGTPSIGLLQVIKPTFDAYHVEGTAYDQRDPVANIVAACNYAAKTYGSIDNVNGPY